MCVKERQRENATKHLKVQIAKFMIWGKSFMHALHKSSHY